MNMLQAIYLVVRMRTTIIINSFLFWLKKIPLIKKLFVGKVYGDQSLKIGFSIAAYCFKIFQKFVLTAVYYLVIMCLALGIFDLDGVNQGYFYVLMYLLLLPVAGAVLNNENYGIGNDTEIAIRLFRFPANLYIKCQYLMQMVTYYVINVLVLMVATLFVKSMPLFFAFLLPAYSLAWKCIVSITTTAIHKRQKKETPVGIWILNTILFLVGCFGFALPVFAKDSLTPALCYKIFAFFLIPGLLCGILYFKENDYLAVIKKVAWASEGVNKANNAEVLAAGKALEKEDAKDRTKYDKRLNEKKGFEYFHALFLMRHKKLVYRPIFFITLFDAGIVILAILCAIFIPGIQRDFYQTITNHLSAWLIVLYFTTVGKNVISVMYINCDSSMLSYRFYRSPKAVLSMFLVRLKSLIRLNAIPALIVALGTGIIYWIVCPKFLILDFALVVISIMSMSLFFSIHTLILYYLCQPFTKEMVIKSPSYTVINILTYYVSYFLSQESIKLTVFAPALIGFCVLYMGLAAILVFKKAPKTFRLR